MPPTEQEYQDTFTRDELADEARERGLPSSGVKAELAAALADHDAQEAAAPGGDVPDDAAGAGPDPVPATDEPAEAPADGVPVVTAPGSAEYADVTPVAGSELPEQPFNTPV